ncbi:SusC/RagA family TonB-linked outer membrane protein [Marinilabilia salmonicolor]|uniref:SusC/RagA family TonB-linked outer membrane protein n=1 Tax=Marinilabilia salmonicolor TaxID=989 RepID=UPI00029B3C62|nr:TonB-dependent receptor [Marinilabilia salmonicolor]
MKKMKYLKKEALTFVVFFLCFSVSILAQNVRITGTVNDNTGQPLPGVNIIVEGTSTGTITDVDGNYSLEAPSDGALVFNFIGFASQTVPIDGRSEIDVVLEQSDISLSEVVVVGYGTQKRENLTGAVTDIRAERMENKPVSSLTSALQGEAAGVSIVNSGGPGQEPVIQIRGVGSVNLSSAPLYVVDGMPVGSIEGLDPNSIQSVSILKDASSAAIYGSRAANGVLLITTKKGNRGGEITINIDASTGTQQMWKTLDLMNREQYMDFATEYLTNAGSDLPARFSNMNAPIYPGASQTFAETDTDWQDELFRSAPISKVNVDLTGGTEKFRFFTSYGFIDQEGIMVGTDYQRHSTTFNAEFKINDFLTIGENVTGSYGIRNNEKESGGRTMIKHIVNQIPYIPASVPVGTEGYEHGYRTTAQVDDTDPENPLRIAEQDKDIYKRANIIGNAFAELSFTDWLKFKSVFGMEYTSDQTIIDSPKYKDDYNERVNHELEDNRFKFYSRIYTNQLTFDKSFNQHEINAVAVVEEQITTGSRLIGRGEHETNLLNQLDGTINQSVAGNLNETTLISYTGRVNYSFADKYLLSASFRRDGSSKFAPGNKWGNFPGASIGWVVSKESFMQDIDLISNLKLRASYGKVGNNALGAYDWQSTINQNTWAVFNSNAESNPGAYYGTLPNEDLEWEITTMQNFGFDLSLLNYSVTFSAEYFKREVDNLLLQKNLPASLGYIDNPWTNVGAMENSGLELSAGYHKRAGEFQFSVTANLGTINNEVTDLDGKVYDQVAVTGDYGGGTITRTQEGEPVQGFYGYKVDGIFQSQSEINALNQTALQQFNQGNVTKQVYQNEGTSPGDIKFKDLDGNGVINEDDRTVIGNFLPDFSYGLNFSGSYKNFDISMQVQGVYGNDIYSGTKVLTQGMMRLFNSDVAVLDAWTPSNTNTHIPRAVNADPNNNARTSDRFIEDGSYMRIKNLTIGYNFSDNLLSGISGNSIKGLKLYVTAQNLLTLTDYYGYDPEIAHRGDNNMLNGADFGQYPQPRTFLFGVKATF